MDKRLVSWGRAVKSRNRRAGWRAPPLWLFSDEGRVPDVVAAVCQLPKGLCGVVLRHDGVAARAQLARRVWQVCRSRQLTLVVAGGPAGGGPWGRHLRGGRGAAGVARAWTGSAHRVADLVRVRRSGAGIAFLSPVFATASHAGEASHGAVRWAALARMVAGVTALPLGGIDGRTVRLLPRAVRGAGAIGALSPAGAIVAAAPHCPAIAMPHPV